jgi:DMSO/TMAO reductase YedYZ molybdopterin-dependent catalytic subunit
VETSWLRDSAAHSSDAWVWQSGDRASLLPLSGAVPFNGEPPLSDLSEHIITPTKLHHVRNHGPVPRIDEQSYRLQVCVEEGRPEKNDDGSIKEPPVRVMRQWSMEELRALPMQSRLVTLSCDGVRRKELNLLEHTKGLNNGPGTTGNSVWSGATLVELLRRSGITQAQAEKYAFILIDGLDKPAMGHYCTSLPRAYALDPCNDVMVVCQHNGEPLRPDHGAPLRLLVPGQIAARSIKWLGRLCLSQEESRNHYHHADNKLAPSAVSLSEWNSGRLFNRADFTLYEQLINSVISYPAHEEWIQLDSPHPGATRIPLRGIASAGGGRRVLRVEVSADGGNSWMPCELTYSDVHLMTEQQQQQQQQQPPSESQGKAAEEEEDQKKAAAEAKQQEKPQRTGGEGNKKEEKKSGEDASDAQKKAYNAALHRVLSERIKCWSWTFWHAELPAWQLMTPITKEIMVRASDEAYDTQSASVHASYTPMHTLYHAAPLQCGSPSLCPVCVCVPFV